MFMLVSEERLSRIGVFLRTVLKHTRRLMYRSLSLTESIIPSRLEVSTITLMA
jgi:hypothetical protein